jgi:hypothetical protein
MSPRSAALAFAVCMAFAYFMDWSATNQSGIDATWFSRCFVP